MGSMSAKQEAEAAKLIERLKRLLMEDGHPVIETTTMDCGHQVALVVRVRDAGSTFPRGIE